MIIDSHVHVWVQQPEKYPWSPIGGYVPESEAPAEALLSLMDAAGVESAVLVQPTPYGWDNSYLLDAAKRFPNRFRCVCLVDPMAEDAPQILSQLVEQHGIAGIRINWHIKPVEVWQTDVHHRALWQTVSRLGLPVCLQLTPKYFDLLREMVEEFDLRVVIDHLGRPKTAASLEDVQFVKLLDLAQDDRIYVKLSGLNYYSGESSPYRDVWPLLKTVYDRFGAQRCMWGSDFPFVQDHWSYAGLLDTVRNGWQFDADGMAWVLGGTALNLWW